MTSIVYSGTTLTDLLGGYDTSFCTQVINPTNIQQGGVDLNVLYAGYDGLIRNAVTQTGKIRANGVDIASLFNKKNATFDVSGDRSSLPGTYYLFNGPKCGIIRFYDSNTLIQSSLIQRGVGLTVSIPGTYAGKTIVWAISARPAYLDSSAFFVRLSLIHI